MDEMMKTLAMAFRNFACTADGGVLDMNTTWKGSTLGVEAVRVTLTGTDPLTGEQLSPDLYRVDLSRTKHSDRSRPLPLYGDYALRFEAIGRNGSSLGSFRKPYPIRIENRAYRPKLSYRLERDGKWDRLTVESNCPRRWSGHLWARRGERVVPLYWDGKEERGLCSFWFWHEDESLRFESDEQELPLEKAK